MTKKILILLVILFCSAAFAEEQEGEAQFKDWNAVVSLLRLNGVDASKVSWTEIETACMALKGSVPENAYNKCKFDKALDQNQFGNDQSYCQSAAEQKYIELVENARNHRNQLNNQQATDFKNAAFITCMHDSKWNDPNTWVRGRRTK